MHKDDHSNRARSTAPILWVAVMRQRAGLTSVMCTKKRRRTVVCLSESLLRILTDGKAITCQTSNIR